jgi:hypothetical protein
MSDTAAIQVNVFDGTRQMISSDLDLLIQIFDGDQERVRKYYSKGPSVKFDELPYYDNSRDNHTVIAYTDHYRQAGFQPVQISPKTPQVIDLMLLPKDYAFNFSAADWENLKQTLPQLHALLAHGAADDEDARVRYNNLMGNGPRSLAALFNITTAMSAIHLPVGTPLTYFKELIWDDTMQQDRFFGYADKALVEQVRQAAAQGEFAPEIGSGFFHHGATSSYKQVQFGEANVQLTFHENDTRKIDDVDCIVVEPDIDYYNDPIAHSLLEVLSHSIGGGKTDPLSVYVLRWLAGRHAGVPEFNPPYSIERGTS